MKKRIFRTLAIFSTISVSIVALVITALSVHVNMRQVERTLQETTQSLAASYPRWDSMDDCRYFLDALSDNIRVTLIDSDGTVLY